MTCERLDEKEVDLDAEESQDAPETQTGSPSDCVEEENQGEDIIAEEDEEIIIEEFED